MIEWNDVRCRLFQPENDLLAFYPNTGNFINTNRFQLMCRLLSQYWLLEHLSASLDYQQIKKNMFGYNNYDNDVVDESRNTQNDTSKTFLSDSIMGSSRHRKKLALNTLHIAAHLNKPHLFTTMTVDPNCGEIKEQLLEVQSDYAA